MARNWCSQLQLFESEPDSHASQHSLRRAHHHQFVIHRVLVERFLEEVAHRDQHLPLGVRKIQERQRLIYLNVEADTSVVVVVGLVVYFIRARIRREWPFAMSVPPAVLTR